MSRQQLSVPMLRGYDHMLRRRGRQTAMTQSGAKNAALPAMAASILTNEPVVLENIPDVRDIQTERNLLVSMGAEVELGYGRAHHRTTVC